MGAPSDIRHQALQDSLLKYNTGKPCKRGHMADRYTKTCICVECAKENEDAIRAKKGSSHRKEYFKQYGIKRRQAAKEAQVDEPHTA